MNLHIAVALFVDKHVHISSDVHSPPLGTNAKFDLARIREKSKLFARECEMALYIIRRSSKYLKLYCILYYSKTISGTQISDLSIW